ncbi:uncharacterized protein LOC144111391 isoform X2 [Amblyomma americanum]
MCPQWRLPTSPLLWCNGIKEIPTGNQMGKLCAQGSKTTPSSRLSSFSQSLSVHAPLPSFIGSPEMQLGHMKPQPLVERELRTERFAVPPSPSMYLHAKEEWQRSPVYMWSGGSQDLNYCQSKANPGELSRSRDTKLWDEHLYAKYESDLSASYEAWELLPFFLLSDERHAVATNQLGLRTSAPGAAAGSWTGTVFATRTFICTPARAGGNHASAAGPSTTSTTTFSRGNFPVSGAASASAVPVASASPQTATRTRFARSIKGGWAMGYEIGIMGAIWADKIAGGAMRT